MSALPAWAFGSIAPALEDRGFQPIPITVPRAGDPNAGKAPAMREWQVPRAVAERLPRYARCGVGLLTATTPAVDIDVRHVELADSIDRIVVDEFGDGPVRYGQAPKRLRVYRASSTFAKMTTQGYRLPGDEPGAKAHKVEVLADGQQFVAYGIHPTTGMAYAWPLEAPLDLERDDLPELSAERASRFVARAEAILARAGTVVSSRTRPTTPVADRRSGPAPRPVRDLAEARRVLQTLAAIDPSGLDRDTWIATAYGVKAALGEYGRGPWLAWSSRSSKHGASGSADTPARMWARIHPQRCGWRFLERLAQEIAGGR